MCLVVLFVAPPQPETATKLCCLLPRQRQVRLNLLPNCVLCFVNAGGGNMADGRSSPGIVPLLAVVLGTSSTARGSSFRVFAALVPSESHTASSLTWAELT